MPTILVPTDFSENAYNALSYACHLAKEIKAEIRILNCYKVPFGQGTIMIEFNDIMERDSLNGLSKLVDKLKSEPYAHHLKIETETYFGFLYDAIDHLKKESKIDLIVMGTNGATNAANKIFGSNTFQVVKQNTLPILVIPPDAKWTGFKNIVIAVDLTKNTEADLIKPLKTFAPEIKFNIDILQIVEDDEKKLETKKMEAKMIASAGQSVINFHFVPAETIADGIMDYITSTRLRRTCNASKKLRFFEKMMRRSVTKI